MSKKDNIIINNLKILSLDMLEDDSSLLQAKTANLFYSLFANNLRYDVNNSKWPNRDRLIVTKKLWPMLYISMHVFGYTNDIDILKDYKKSNALSYSIKSDLEGIEAGNVYPGDIIALASGIAVGERLLNSLSNNYGINKSIIDFNTYCVCLASELNSGLVFESLSNISEEQLDKFILIVIEDESNNVLSKYKSLNFDIFEINNNLSSIDEVISEASDNDKPSIIYIKNKNDKETLEYLYELRKELNNDIPFNIEHNIYIEARKIANKRLFKVIDNWQNNIIKYADDSAALELINFLNNSELEINFNSKDIKFNKNYCEELMIGNSKIMNIIGNKSPFILFASDNFDQTSCLFNKSEINSKDNPLGRNILCKNYPLILGGLTCGLAHLGFKVFASTSLINSNYLNMSIKYSIVNKLDIKYVFTHNSFLSSNKEIGYYPLEELDTLNLIPNLIVIRPSDINEIIGAYEYTLKNKETTALIIGNEKCSILEDNEPKYIIAGAYRAKKEEKDLDGIIIASGEEVHLAVKLASELLTYGIDLRVVSMPSMKIFQKQNTKYKNMLIPKDVKTFGLQFSDSTSMLKYVSNEEYLLSIKDFSLFNTKEEILKNYKFDLDSLKARVIEKYKK